ncbi:MAG: ABC transporter permease [Bacteroidetes bacterium]|nr:MAG: ABC transporter permease [Bacteroidota bacterium]
MIFGGKKRAMQAAHPPGRRGGVLAALKRTRTGRWCWRLLQVWVVVALFADFLANEKPLVCSLEGRVYFPVMRQYAVDLGWAHWESRFFQTPWREQPYDWVLFPPIPYSPKTLDTRHFDYVSPFDRQEVPHWRWRHWLGTYPPGFDVAAGMVCGARVALLVGVVALSLATFIGLVLGGVAGFFGDEGLRCSRGALLAHLLLLPPAIFYGVWGPAVWGGGGWTVLAVVLVYLSAARICSAALSRWALLKRRLALPMDLLVMRFIEVVNSIPGLLLLLALVAVMERSGLFQVMVVIGLIAWTGIARFVRAELLRIRKLEYIEAARALGLKELRILLRHALPNALTPVFIAVAFGMAGAVLLEATLSFLGIGVGDAYVTWGRLLSEARTYPKAWWLAIFPGGAVFLAVALFNVLGERLSGQAAE